MKLLARIAFLLLTIACGFWVLATLPRLLASFKDPNSVAAAIGGTTFPFLLFVLFLVCWGKFRPDANGGQLMAPARQSGSTTGKTISVLFLGLLITFFVYLGFALLKNPRSAKVERSTNVQGATWTTRTIKELTLESPWDFQLSNNPGSPAGNPDKTEYAEQYDSTASSKNFHVGITRIGFKPGIHTDLDAAVESVVSGIKRSATSAGDANPKVDVKSSKVGDLEARTLTYVGNTSPNRLRVDGLYIQDGQKMWNVMIVYQSDFQAADATRILKSIRVNR